MKKLALALTTLVFLQAQELEVEGNLKVQGNIDANNQRVTNVGSPTDLQDAVNTEFLQDALRDDGNYEYKMYMIKNEVSGWDVTNIKFHLYGEMNENSWNSDFHLEFLSITSDGWMLSNSIAFTEYSGQQKSVLIFKRPLEE